MSPVFFALMASLTAAPAASEGEAPTEGTRPNIIFLMDDQHRCDALGKLDAAIRTPTLDRLASDGILFDQAVCQAPMCVPSRYSLMLGLYPTQVGVLSNGPGLSDMARNMEGAVQMPITRQMLSGNWQEVAPAAIAGKDFSNHLDRLWVTQTPGAKLTFKFTGTRAWIFNAFGPKTGRVKLTVDGLEKGIRQQVDVWPHSYRLGGLEIASNLPLGEHTATVELLSDPPDRTVPIESAKKANRYKPADFKGVALHLAVICAQEGLP